MISRFLYFQNLALALLFGLVYHGAFWIQLHWLSAFDFVQGVSLLFIPAGIKMLAIVVGGIWGIGGVFVSSLLLSPLVWGDHGFFSAFAGQVVWAGMPYGVYQWLKRQLRIDDTLQSANGTHIVAMAITTSFASSLADRSYRLLTGGIHGDIFNVSVWAMLLGDIGGIVLTLSLTTFLVHKMRPSLR